MQNQTERTSDVIASDRVEGTVVYGADNAKMGSVDKVLIGKRNGQVTDAILSIGGFLGIGDEKHSIPWSKLNYDTELGGYKLDVDEEEIRNAPRFDPNDTDRVYDREYQTRVYDYWTATPYW
ncbi:MAG: PRC-barrel domain-containing protein [Sphingorhabdus sp.]|nr:PRC-barrel domain-containing protein [Sphingorhabdus sp.]